MRQRRVVPLLLALGLVGCEQQVQELPFSVAEQSTEKTVASGGGTISTAAGASVAFPAGSVTQSTAVTLTAVPAPAETQKSGTPVSTAFSLQPAGTVLNNPASVEMKLNASGNQRAWLATVVNVTPQGVQEIGSTRVDLSTGVVDTKISTLGTIAAVIPDEKAVVVVGTLSAAQVPAASGAPTELAGASTRSVQMSCGGPGNRCDGLSVGVSSNLLSMVTRAAAIYPKIHADLTIDGGRASGSLSVSTTLRAQLKSDKTSENVAVSVVIRPTGRTTVTETASRLVLSHMEFMISGNLGDQSDAERRIDTLVIPKPGVSGLVTVDRSFSIRTTTGGDTEPAQVKVTFPVKLQS